MSAAAGKITEASKQRHVQLAAAGLALSLIVSLGRLAALRLGADKSATDLQLLQRLRALPELCLVVHVVYVETKFKQWEVEPLFVLTKLPDTLLLNLG